MSHPSFNHVSPVVDHQSNGHSGASRTVDWTGYPALFQRIPDRPTRTTIQAEPEPRRAARMGRDIREAFLGYCQAMLLTPESARRHDRPSERSAAAGALLAAESFGFTREELRWLGCGLYPGAAAVREHLRGVGFSDAEIDAARLVRDAAGRPRAELAGNLILPLNDRNGQTRDYLLVAIDLRQSALASFRYLLGVASTDITAHGLQAALSHPASRESLVLVENILEGLLLQCRGIHGVVAIGGGGRDFSPRRWEELVRLGVKTVTLAFRQNERHAANVREALVNALRARTAPEVYVACDYPAGEEGPLDVLRRFGRETCTSALANRTLAFHQKDFSLECEPEAAEPEVPTRAVVEEPYYRVAFRQHLSDLIAALPVEHRAVHAERIAAADDAIRASDWERLRRLVDRVEPSEIWTNNSMESAERYEQTRSTYSSGNSVLERLGARIRSATRFHWTTDHPPRAGSPAVDWLVNGSPEARLEMLCDQVLDDCERESERHLVIACHDHSDQEIMLVLTRRLAARLGRGISPTLEEVRHRLGGFESWFSEPETRLAIDDAVHRLGNWSRRLNFVACDDALNAAETLERILENRADQHGVPIVFLDGVPPVKWQKDENGDPFGWIEALAQRFGVRVHATTDAPPARNQRPNSRDIPASEAQIQSVLADWEQRERETAKV